jgi:hypothetical protein
MIILKNSIGMDRFSRTSWLSSGKVARRKTIGWLPDRASGVLLRTVTDLTFGNLMLLDVTQTEWADFAGVHEMVDSVVNNPNFSNPGRDSRPRSSAATSTWVQTMSRFLRERYRGHAPFVPRPLVAKKLVSFKSSESTAGMDVRIRLSSF